MQTRTELGHAPTTSDVSLEAPIEWLGGEWLVMVLKPPNYWIVRRVTSRYLLLVPNPDTNRRATPKRRYVLLRWDDIRRS